MSIRTSITSRVVPAISDVMAASRPASAFRSVDLPAFGAPMIATSKPSRIRSAARPPCTSCRRSACTARPRARTSGATSTGTSSSAKSMVASINAAARINFSRHSSALRPIAPDRTRNACRRCASVSASIRSARPSTWARSSLPFSNARRVNSPGSANRSPGSPASARITACTTATDPCSCNSAAASPVKLSPSGNRITSA